MDQLDRPRRERTDVAAGADLADLLAVLRDLSQRARGRFALLRHSDDDRLVGREEAVALHRLARVQLRRLSVAQSTATDLLLGQGRLVELVVLAREGSVCLGQT